MPRVIKKYGNRRLYDTEASQYVNLGDVAKMIRQGETIEVLDAKSGEDLTRQVLTQIIVEDSRRSEGGAPIEFLQNMIRASDRAQHDFFQWYLSTAAQAYERIQRAWRESASWPPAAPQWQDWLRMWDPLHALDRLAPKPPSSGTKTSEGSPGEGGATARRGTAAPSPSDGLPPRTKEPNKEIDELRRRLEQLEQRLR